MNWFFQFLNELAMMPRCYCCGTYKNVTYWGYADSEYCTPCAVEHGYKIYPISKCKAKRGA